MSGDFTCWDAILKFVVLWAAARYIIILLWTLNESEPQVFRHNLGRVYHEPQEGEGGDPRIGVKQGERKIRGKRKKGCS